MTRLSPCVVLALAVSTAAACRPAAPTGAEPAARADDKNLQIVMTENDGALGLDSACVGTVTPPTSRVERGRKVRWHVDNDRHNPCPDLDKKEVTLKFDVATMSDDLNAGSPAYTDVVWKNNKLERRVHRNAAHAPDTPNRKYYVYYRGEKASPDPEFDIEGDCSSSCGGDD